jgi:hypothetical protein
MIQFDDPVLSHAGRLYTARACGRLMEDNRRWEGWIEFVPDTGEPVLRTPRETVQPNRDDLLYWATGLTAAYLEGALKRALEPPRLRVRNVAAEPAYDGPAPTRPHRDVGAPPITQPRAVLDPFVVFAQGEDTLRSELSALSESHLRNVIRAHELVDEDEVDVRVMGRAALAELIVAAVNRRIGA